MRIAIAGGALQGTEAAYLARRAGWETLLIDRNGNAPASGLCDRMIQADIGPDAHPEEKLLSHLKNVDWILPAVEDREALSALIRLSQKAEIPLAFDPTAYAISSSKQKSNRVFAAIDLSVPRSWPGCRLPVIVKPDGESGSKGVEILFDAAALSKRFGSETIPPGWVVQEFIEGPSYSLEVVGSPGSYATPQVTDLFMDEVFDCKGVCAPSQLPVERIHDLERLSLRIADAIQLNGIMDVEVILAGDSFMMLEIDARLPSQTPTAVLWSTGFNMLEHLGGIFLGTPKSPAAAGIARRSVRYEHIEVTRGVLRICGEHIMSKARPLRAIPDFFGADEALTDYRAGCEHWFATLIHAAGNPVDLSLKRKKTLKDIRSRFGLSAFVDSAPAPVFARSIKTP